MMRVAPFSTAPAMAWGRSGWPCSRNAASMRSNPPSSPTFSATRRTDSLADSILEPCAKITMAVAGIVMIAVSQMFLVLHPSDARIRQILESQANESFSYAAVGATQNLPPPGYQVNHQCFQLGRGHDAFERAKQAVREWRMFDIGWLEL